MQESGCDALWCLAFEAENAVVAWEKARARTLGFNERSGFCCALFCLAEPRGVIMNSPPLFNFAQVAAAPWGIQMMWKAFRANANKATVTDRLAKMAMAAGKTAVVAGQLLSDAVVAGANEAARLAAKNVDPKMLRAALVGSLQVRGGARGRIHRRPRCASAVP